MQILAEEWKKRDEEREEKTSQTIREYMSLKDKLDSKEVRLSEKELYFLKREREVSQNSEGATFSFAKHLFIFILIQMEDIVSKLNFDHAQRLEDSKLRAARMKDQYKNEIDLFMVKMDRSEAEIKRLNGKVQALEVKLRAKEHEIDRLNASRSQWPDISLERKVMQLEEKVSSIQHEINKIQFTLSFFRIIFLKWNWNASGVNEIRIEVKLKLWRVARISCSANEIINFGTTMKC